MTDLPCEPFFKEAVNSLKASRFTLLMAKWFGRKIVMHDGRYIVEFRIWLGVKYFIDFREDKTETLRSIKFEEGEG